MPCSILFGSAVVQGRQVSVFRQRYEEDQRQSIALGREMTQWPRGEGPSRPQDTEAIHQSRGRCRDAVKGVAVSVSKSLILPVTAPIDATCPDCRIFQPMEGWYAVTFLVAFGWIGLWSMVVTVVTNRWVVLLGHPSALGFVGLCVVALGAEIPDAINAVTVASRGYGSMAASSCIGSQICNICLGLGVPWSAAAWAGEVPLTSQDRLLEDASLVLLCVVIVFLCFYPARALAQGSATVTITANHGTVMIIAYLLIVCLLGEVTISV
mmetsp:Transcript_6186/g.14977  ORF Transcript_6186/g.14977 Transcript_6186/m.14977 type:complete len:267 (-) Transcript_6186:65-865(-)